MAVKQLGLPAVDPADVVVKSELDAVGGGLSASRHASLEADFYNTTAPWAFGMFGTAVSSGAVAFIADTANHPGILELRDSATANAGYVITTAGNSHLLAGGEKVSIVWQARNATASTVGWLGFRDNANTTEPVDGVFVKFVGNGAGGVTLTATTRSNNAQTASASTYTLAINTWVRLVIELNSTATLATYTVYSEAGAELWTTTVNANIPTGAGRHTSIGVAAFETTTSATAGLMWIDYLLYECSRTITR